MIKAVIFIAGRHLVARRRQSLLTIAGLAVGVMVLISAISMMDGMKVSFIEQMLQVSPHVTVKADLVRPKPQNLIGGQGEGVVSLRLPDLPDEETEITNYRAIGDKLARVRGVRTAAPELTLDGFLVYGTLKKAAQIQGVVPDEQEKIGNLRSRVIAGDYESFQAGSDCAILGYRLARSMTLGVGDYFQAVGKTGELITFKVCALVKTGMTAFDQSHAMVHLEKAQRLEGTPQDRVSLVNVRVVDPERAAPIARRMEAAGGRVSETWQVTHANVFSLFNMIGGISYFLVVFTMLAAGLGVSNMLTTMVLQKKKDIAVLLSMGYSRRAISMVFLLEGVALGTAGALVGCLLGYLDTQLLGAIPFEFGEDAVISRNTLYMNQSGWYYALSAGFGFAVSLVAGLWPARRASRLDPVEIIRTEV